LKRAFILCIFALLLLTSLTACDITIGPTGSATPTPTSSVGVTASPTTIISPTSTVAPATPTSTTTTLASDLTRIITAYYNDIEARNYTQAYTYLDAQATDTTTNQTLTQSSFIQQAQAMDSEEGPVVSFDIAVFPPQTQVTMTVTRSHLGPYHAQLDMKQEDNTWKIASLDRI